MPDSYEPDDELPWTEDQWEAFMKRSDVRSAKFGELFETLREHPDREDIIAKEMGWDRMRGQLDEEEAAARVEEWNRICEEAVNDPDIQRQMEESDRELEALPAYQKANEFALNVYQKLEPFFAEKDDEEADDDLVDLFGSSHTIGVKIAGGHGIGYEDDAICGNIVNCKRALKAAEESIESLNALRQKDVVPTELLEEFMRDAEDTRRLVADHIEELRKRVWWE